LTGSKTNHRAEAQMQIVAICEKMADVTTGKGMNTNVFEVKR
jgi:hypothetical protein